jgi:hypothetical protein
MSANIKKTLASGLVALTAIATFAAAPAQAKPFPKPFPHPHHHGFGGWGAAGLIGGLTLGAIAASTASSYDCGTIRQTVVDEYGNIVGYRYVPAC